VPDRRDPRRGKRAVGGVEDVAHRQRVRHREHDVLGAGEQLVECVRVAGGRLRPALPSAGARRVRRVTPGPGAICGQRSALEGAEADLVEAREHEPGHLAVAEREVERLLSAHEPGGHAEVELGPGERLAERQRLSDSLLRQAGTGRRRADRVVGVRAGVRVAHEHERPQKSTLR